MGLTQEVANYVFKLSYKDIPPDLTRLARGFILDGLGVALAGSIDECSRIVQAQVQQMGAKKECVVLGTALSAPPAKAALANGVAAMPWITTTLSFPHPKKPSMAC